MKDYLPFVVFEGNSGAGKSTVSRLVARSIGCEPVIGEYYDFLDEHMGYVLPPYPPTDVEEVRRSNAVWPAIDVVRAETRQRLGAFAIMDTSPLSVFGYECAKARLGMPYLLSDLADSYAIRIAAGSVSQPSGWVFLYATPEVLTKRLARKGGTRPLLQRPETMRYLDAFRRFFCSHYLREIEYVSVSSRIGGIDMQKVTEFVATRPAYETTGFNRFVQDLRTGGLSVPQLLNLEPSGTD
jgi:hypothetical protein